MTATTPRIVRAALYQRVSSEEQIEGYSLDAQDRAGRLYCQTHGWEVVQVYRDEGRSARTDDLAKRPAFQQMLADAEAGLIDVVVVHKLDRFARNRRVAFEAFERLGKARVGFVSFTEQMDYSSPSGQLMLTMLVGLSQFYSDNLSLETKKGKAERKAQGLLQRSRALRSEEACRDSGSRSRIRRPTPDCCWPSSSRHRARVIGTLPTPSTRPATGRPATADAIRSRKTPSVGCCKTGSIWASCRMGKGAGSLVRTSPCSMRNSSPRRQLPAAPTSPDR